jgi:hypothetical protein
MDYSMYTINTLLFLAAWLAYFIVHSLLASLAVKKWIAARWPDFMPAYRLAFNMIALVLLLANGGVVVADALAVAGHEQVDCEWVECIGGAGFRLVAPVL